MDPVYTRRGFLPESDPLTRFPRDSPFSVLDEVGRDLPSLLEDPGFRSYARELEIPLWPDGPVAAADLPALRLCYVRLGFLASAYVNQVGQEPVSVLPANIAVPLCRVCRLLGRPAVLSYDGYALYNWKRFRPSGPIALGNIDTLQNFVHLYDEHWFILVHVEIEAIAADILRAIDRSRAALARGGSDVAGGCGTDEEVEADERVEEGVRAVEDALRRQTEVLKRIPEKMDPSVYYRTFRRYIRFFEDVAYEGVERAPLSYRGETGAQSSVLPTVLAFLKVPHKPSPLTNHLADMRNYMPPAHRALIEEVEAMPSPRPLVSGVALEGALDALAAFREVHLGWARQYIHRWEDDPRGTGGTPYMEWLKQLIDETRAYGREP